MVAPTRRATPVACSSGEMKPLLYLQNDINTVRSVKITSSLTKIFESLRCCLPIALRWTPAAASLRVSTLIDVLVLQTDPIHPTEQAACLLAFPFQNKHGVGCHAVCDLAVKDKSAVDTNRSKRFSKGSSVCSSSTLLICAQENPHFGAS